MTTGPVIAGADDEARPARAGTLTVRFGDELHTAPPDRHAEVHATHASTLRE